MATSRKDAENGQQDHGPVAGHNENDQNPNKQGRAGSTTSARYPDDSRSCLFLNFHDIPPIDIISYIIMYHVAKRVTCQKSQH